MWDLNRTERRALAAAALLVAISGVARLGGGTTPGGTKWETISSAVGSASPRADVAEALEREARAQTPLAPSEKVDVGRAPAEELRRLPGVGPALAEAIIRERSARPFASVSDLDRVPGIGPATLARLRDRVEVSATGAGPAPEPSDACGDARVDLNTADSKRLQSLPGVGPALASRIIEHRIRSGRLDAVDRLIAVPGIGEATLARLAPLACTG